MGAVILYPQSHEAWLQVRQGGIGSSEVATIIGLNPYETLYQLWRRKKGLDEAQPENFLMKLGHYLEDCVSRLWADDTGYELIADSAAEFIVQDSEHPFLQVSPDRLYHINETPYEDMYKGILECKTTQMRINPDELPKHWFCQLQYQLGIAGLQHGALAWLTAGREFGHREFDFDSDFFAYIKEEAIRFWQDCIIGNREPDIVDPEDLSTKFAIHSEGVYVEMGDDMVETVSELKGVNEQLSVLEARKRSMENTLKSLIGEAEGLTYQGATVATWKTGKGKAKFDFNRFEEEHPALAIEYTTLQPGVRRFILK